MQKIFNSLRALLFTQFFEALNDNLFKVLVSLIVISEVVGGGGSKAEFVMSGVCFVLPYLIFSSISGSLADRYSKTTVIRLVKIIEVVIMAIMFFALREKNINLLLVGLFGLGAHSALFSPAKFGIIPEIVKNEHISKANGYMQMVIFIACIAGTGFGGVLKGISDEKYTLAGVIVIAVALMGFLSSFFIEKTPAANFKANLEFNPLNSFKVIKKIRRHKPLFLVLIASSYFWALAAYYQMLIPIYAKELLGLSDLKTSALLAVLGIGTGIGSIFAGKVSEGRVELGLIPIGGFGLAFTSLGLALLYQNYWIVVFLLFLMGISCGFFIVPLNSYYQETSPVKQRGSYIAASNVASYAAMLLTYVLLYLLYDVLSLDAVSQFWFFVVITFMATVFICNILPEVFIRCLNWLLVHSLYRLKVIGAENIPEEGGALIICNHVSFVDPPVLMAACKRPIRFMIYRPIYEKPVVHQLAKMCRAIPVNNEDSPKEVIRSLNEAKDAIKKGDIVCIFAEGELSRIGHLLSFKKGFERIMKGLDAPIIPAYIDQIWGSIFSFRSGKFFWKIPKQFPYPLTLKFGKPLSADSKSYIVRQKIQEISAELPYFRKERYPTLTLAFLAQAKRRLFATAVVESSGKKLNYLKLLLSVFSLRNKILQCCNEYKMVGILLPPSIAGMLTNLSLMLAEKIPVNLNYTAAEDSLSSAIKQCKITKIISSKTFMEKIKLKSTAEIVFIEDLIKEVNLFDQFSSCIKILLPISFLGKYVFKFKTQIDDLATVIFSSGSTAEPKGVMLTHRNINSNLEGIYELYGLDNQDAILGILPFFHSFGFTATLWLPLLCGIKAVYHHNPTDAAIVGDLVEKEKVTFLMSTPSFLMFYVRKCTKENFKSLRYVIVGAEKLNPRIAEMFLEKFNVQPMEGYGCTELSPVATLNIPSFQDSVINQIGYKSSTVGHPIPGVTVRIVDIDSHQVLPPNSEGLLLVKGPNVMKGYLNNEAKTKEVIIDGWYVTGDIAKIDEDGFITITDRLSRFSKIAGEMVPHNKIEEAIHLALGESQAVCAVTAVSDEKKGEKLVVISSKKFDVPVVINQLSENGLPNLWIPKQDSFFFIDTLPYLGTGKLDLKQLKNLALEFISKF